MPPYFIVSFATRALLGIAIAGTLPAVAFAHTNGPRPASPSEAMNGPMHEHPAAGKGPVTGAAEPGGSPWVKAIQASLNRAEHAHLAVDGKMDTATHATLKRFQKTHGLKVTGRPDKATRRALGL